MQHLSIFSFIWCRLPRFVALLPTKFPTSSLQFYLSHLVNVHLCWGICLVHAELNYLAAQENYASSPENVVPIQLICCAGIGTERRWADRGIGFLVVTPLVMVWPCIVDTNPCLHSRTCTSLWIFYLLKHDQMAGVIQHKVILLLL